MGHNAITAISIGSILLLSALYYAPDASSHLQKFLTIVGVPDHHVKSILSFLKFNELDISKVPETQSETTEYPESGILLTSEQLKKYDGGPDSEGLYLAILGEVFDVAKGAQHYKPGGGYAFFTGRDATRAYITGDFSENGLIDDVDGLDDASLVGIEDWLSFYREEYQPVGKVIGRYYDQSGNPTEKLLSVREKIVNSQKNKWLEDKNKLTFPPCNSEWSKEKGSKVWCSKKSGGVDRDWVGVPRELHTVGKDPRCVCVKNSGPPSSSEDSVKHSDRGDLDHPDLKEYQGCPPSSETCIVSHP